MTIQDWSFIVAWELKCRCDEDTVWGLGVYLDRSKCESVGDGKAFFWDPILLLKVGKHYFRAGSCDSVVIPLDLDNRLPDLFWILVEFDDGESQIASFSERTLADAFVDYVAEERGVSRVRIWEYWQGTGCNNLVRDDSGTADSRQRNEG